MGKAIEFHPDTIKFVDAVVEMGILMFSEDEAREVASKYGIRNMYLVWRELKENKIITPYKERFAFNLDKLHYYFGQPEAWN